jgi:Ran GTPase-activating protein (RanGAP) involved in mRNA processing and transport
VNLGEYNFLPDGTNVEQIGFIRMTEEQLQQLARQLQAQPSVTHLNLYGNEIGPEGMRLLAEPIPGGGG